MDRRTFIRNAATLSAAGIAAPLLGAETRERLDVLVETREAVGPLPHVWEECAGSDRAAITLRESWRQDLDRWIAEAGLKRVRFHGVLNDELGVYAPSIQNMGKTKPNFRNVFEVYDGLVSRGISPFVELGFMPKQLASGTRDFGFYKGNITPPKSLTDWGGFIARFVGDLADRYGITAVREWPFEVWNEPNLSFFWSGTQADYLEMYKATAVAVKSVDPRIQVGGPATSAGSWIKEFVDYCATNNAPVDFIATHAYAGGNQEHLYGKGAPFSVNQVIPDTVAKVRATVDASRFKALPVWLSEWSSDSPAMIAHVISQCLPMVRGMSQWVMSGTYEELGVADYLLKEGDMGWSTIVRGIARPSFNTYRLLHALGNQRLSARGPALASRGPAGSVAALVWNLAEAQQPAGIPGASAERRVKGAGKQVAVRFSGARPGQKVRVRFVDQDRGSPMPAWRAMGSPAIPTMAQIAHLRAASDTPPVAMRLDRTAAISLDLPAEGVALIELL
jgi:xylan 1,4-beta-xylosidase